jgi:uncharacterized protein with LGFP repeats
LMRRRRGRGVVETEDEVEVTPDYDRPHDSAYDPPYDSEYGEAPEDSDHWAPRGESSEGQLRTADGSDRDDAGAGYLATRTGWSDRDSQSPRYGDRGPDLFTHRGDHEAEDTDPDDQDAVDTAPTKIAAAQGDEDDASGRHSRAQWSTPDDDTYLPSGPGSLFTPFYDRPPRDDYPDDGYLGQDEEPEDESDDEDWDEPTGQEPAHHDAGTPPAIHLPLDDPNEAPPGYPIKGVMRTGEYHVPESRHFEETVAEIWFASAELAEANGFVPAE